MRICHVKSYIITQRFAEMVYQPYGSLTSISDNVKLQFSNSIHHCESCRPSPSITWKKNGQRIVDGQNSFEIPAPFQGRRLNINSVSRARHQDQYSCEAENALSNGQPLIHNIKLAVEGTPFFHSAKGA